MPDPLRIHVTVVDHPERDAWTDEQAALAAAEAGWTLGDYLGREADAYPDPPDWLRCHVYAATEADEGPS
jgi:hypothetical protein